MTKRLAFLVSIFIVGGVAWADFNFMVQGRLSDNNGNPIGTPTSVEWRLYRDGDPATTGGTPVYTETGLITPINPQGVFSYELGSGTPVGSPLDASAYAGSEPLYALLSVAGTPLLPKLRVTPVPRSHVATLAESVQAGGVNTAALQDGAVTGVKIATSSISGSHVSGTAQLNVDRIGLGGAPATSLDLSAKSDAVRLPTGTSAERPGTPANGDTRYNSTLNAVESYVNGSWQTVSTGDGTVTSVGANAPLSSSGGTTPTISVSRANASTDGYLASGDWATFNSKVDSALPAGQILVGDGSNAVAGVALSGDATISSAGALTLTSTGTAGTYTKVTTDAKGRVTVGDTLSAGDIPNLDAAKITSGVLDAARIPAGTDSGKLPLAGGTMSGSIDMGGNNVTNAGSVAASTVTVGGNNVISTNAPLTSGSVLFANGAASAGQDNGNFFWDNTNKRLGIGTVNPGAKLDIYDVSSAFPASSGASQSAGQRLRLGRTDGAVLDIGSAGGSGLWLQTGNGLNLATTYPMLINPNGGNVGIGTTSPETTLHVSGRSQFIDTSGYNNRAIIIGRTTTDAAVKSSALTSRHWLNSEEPVTLIGAAIDDSAVSAVAIGGGFTNNNAATELRFYTAPDNTTLTGTRKMTLVSSGNVGIGTTNPNGKLDVNQTTAGSVAVQGQNAGTVYWKVVSPAGGITGGYNAADAVEYVAKDSVTGRSINAAGTINASGADFAEWVDWEGPIPAMGSIVMYRGVYVVVSSTQTAAFVGNDIKEPGHGMLVAFTGQLPVLVRGKVHEGDLIVANGDGTGRGVPRSSATMAEIQNAVGTSWASSSDLGLKRVNVAVGIGLAGGSLVDKKILRLETENVEMKVENKRLTTENEQIKNRLGQIEKRLSGMKN